MCVELLLCVLTLHLQQQQVLDKVVEGGVADAGLIAPMLCHDSRGENKLGKQARRLV